jgi:penicillin-binding protein 2
MRLGEAFSDSVTEIRGKSRIHQLSSKPFRGWWTGYGRVTMFASFLVFILCILFLRLAHLTIIRGVEYRRLSDGNRIRERLRYAPRGILKDRTGEIISDTVPFYRLNRPCTEQAGIPCVETISDETGAQKQKEGLPPGEFLIRDYSRQYNLATSFAHLIGYTGEITKEELDDEYYKLRGYTLGERLGRSGAELVFEDRLRGRKGRELVEVDAAGTAIRTLGIEKESAGETIDLSLDAALSRAAEKAFPKDKRGAVIVSMPKTGEVLVLFSSPTFDPNIFVHPIENDIYQKLLDDPAEPILNRAIGGAYPPGSTFKLVTSVAALEEKAVTTGTLIEDVGQITIPPNFVFPNWYFIQYGKTDGMVDIVKAIQRSNDIYFYKAGESLGITKLYTWARKLGIGSFSGIELTGEAEGLMPDPSWKRLQFSTDLDIEMRNNDWYLGDTYHVSIGQGYLLTTPLEVNRWTSVIASAGSLCTPTIEKINSSQVVLHNCREVGISKQTIDTITEGMKRACDTGGTGYPLFKFQIPDKHALDQFPEDIHQNEDATRSAQKIPKISIPIACKTGTAEYGHPENKTHAWFTAFAPVPERFINKADYATEDVVTGDPEIVVTVLVEEGGEGSDVAAPVAKAIFEEWFGR